MTTVGVRELKAKLSAYLRQVQQGEPVAITDRGTIIAEIVPAGWVSAQQVNPILAEMIRKGEIRPPARPLDPKCLEPIEGEFPEGLAQQLLDEIRGER